MRIEATARFEHPHAEVLAWHDRPGALVRLTPPGLATPDAPAEGGMRAGRLVGARLGPPLLPDLLRPHWVLRHIESDGEGHFTDRQARGPWRTWQHQHEITADDTAADGSAASGPGAATSDATGRTAIRDVIDIELPRHLGRLEPLVESQVRRMLSFRTRQLRDDLSFHARFADSPRRTIAIAGSSGLIGTQLTALLETGGHTVRRMIREDDVGPGEISWDPQAGVLDPADLEGVDVVVNLAGRSIATRWTRSARREIRDSRIHGTALIARTLARLSDGPRALVQASAVGYYGGQRPGELLTENDPGGGGFLADVVRDWERAAHPAVGAGLRVAFVRTGVVLSDAGGALLPQLPLFLAGVGGRLNHPEAVTSWITLDDITRAFAHSALSPQVDGPVNGVAPRPATAEEFARTLGRVLRRPSLVPVPSFGPRLLLGAGGASELVQADQNVSDARLQAGGFEAAQAELEPALRHVLRR